MRVGLGLILTLLVSSANADPSVQDVIESHNTELERFYREGMAESAAMFFAEDVWQLPPNSAPVVGRPAYVEFWTQAFQWGSWEFDFDVQDVVVSGKIAVERGKYTLDYSAGPNSPFPSTKDHGNYVVMWRQDSDGEWRIVWDAPVSEVPMGGPLPAPSE